MSLTIFRETFGKERQRLTAVRRNDQVKDHAITTVDAIQRVVDTFRSPDGGRYIVALGRGTTAYTTVEGRRIVVTHEPIFDKRLTIAEACTVMTGLVLHEVGHTLYTFPILDAFAARFGKREPDQHGYVEGRWTTTRANYDRLAYHLWNIADDARLERRMAERVPVGRDVFPSMLHWVAKRGGMDEWRGRWDASGPMKDRVDFALFAVRYPWVATWSGDAVTRAERKWWREWRERYVAIADDDAESVVTAIAEACDRLRNAERDDVEDDGDQPEDLDDEQAPDIDETPPIIIDEGYSFGDDDDFDEDDDDDDDEGEGNGSDSDDDGDEADEDGDEADEDGDESMTGPSSDEPPEDWADEDGDGDQPGDKPSDDKRGDPGKDDGQTHDVDNSHSEDERAGEVNEVPNLKTPDQQPDDFDPERERTYAGVDDLQTNWKRRAEGDQLNQWVEEARSHSRVNFGKYGKARIEVRSI